MSLTQDFAALRTLHPMGEVREIRNTGTTRLVQVVGHRMALDCPCVEVQHGQGKPFPVKAHELRRVRQQTHASVILGRDLTPEDKPALDDFFMMVQARYGRRAANAAIEAAEDAITQVRAENRERGVED